MFVERPHFVRRAVGKVEAAVAASTMLFLPASQTEELHEKAPVQLQEANPRLDDTAKDDDLGKPNNLGYYYLPHSKNGSYIFRDPHCTPEHWGSKELVRFVKDMSHKWKENYPQGYIKIEDLNGPEAEHKSHHRGIDVDLNASTNGLDRVANMKEGNYNQKATTELAKMFADTGKIRLIFYTDEKVIKEVNAYKSPSKNMEMQHLSDHDAHFHVRLDIPALPYWAPEGKKEDCYPTPLKHK